MYLFQTFKIFHNFGKCIFLITPTLVQGKDNQNYPNQFHVENQMNSPMKLMLIKVLFDPYIQLSKCTLKYGQVGYQAASNQSPKKKQGRSKSEKFSSNNLLFNYYLLR